MADNKNNEVIEYIIGELEVARDECDQIIVNHTVMIKLVEAKSDILRAIEKLRKIKNG